MTGIEADLGSALLATRAASGSAEEFARYNAAHPQPMNPSRVDVEVDHLTPYRGPGGPAWLVSLTVTAEAAPDDVDEFQLPVILDAGKLRVCSVGSSDS